MDYSKFIFIYFFTDFSFYNEFRRIIKHLPPLLKLFSFVSLKVLNIFLLIHPLLKFFVTKQIYKIKV